MSSKSDRDGSMNPAQTAALRAEIKARLATYKDHRPEGGPSSSDDAPTNDELSRLSDCLSDDRFVGMFGEYMKEMSTKDGRRDAEAFVAEAEKRAGGAEVLAAGARELSKKRQREKKKKKAAVATKEPRAAVSPQSPSPATVAPSTKKKPLIEVLSTSSIALRPEYTLVHVGRFDMQDHLLSSVTVSQPTIPTSFRLEFSLGKFCESDIGKLVDLEVRPDVVSLHFSGEDYKDVDVVLPHPVDVSLGSAKWVRERKVLRVEVVVDRERVLSVVQQPQAKGLLEAVRKAKEEGREFGDVVVPPEDQVSKKAEDPPIKKPPPSPPPPTVPAAAPVAEPPPAPSSSSPVVVVAAPPPVVKKKRLPESYEMKIFEIEFKNPYLYQID